MIRQINCYTLLMGIFFGVCPFFMTAQDFCRLYPLEGSQYHERIPNVLLKTCAPLNAHQQADLAGHLALSDGSGHRYPLTVQFHTDQLTVHASPAFPLPGDRKFEVVYQDQVLTHFFTGKPKKAARSNDSFFFKNDTLPGDFPLVEITNFGSPRDGQYYLTDPNNGYPYFIVDQEESVLYFKESPKSFANFQYLGNNQYGVFNITDQVWYFLDTSFTVIDSARCVNDLITDFHDVQITPEGNRLLMNYNNQIIDMSVIVPGGQPDALVQGAILQEVSPAGVLIWEWRSWDHFEITDGWFAGFPL
ncbi:MAG: hypothetical protein AAFV80_17450, partial [Bacteroidota bacterium]